MHRFFVAAIVAAVTLVIAPAGYAKPELGVVIDSAKATRFDSPYGYGMCYWDETLYECICPTPPMAGAQLRAVAEKHMIVPDANFCAGAGLYIRPDSQGTLAVYSTEHQGDFEDWQLERFKWAYELTGLQKINLPVQSGVIRFDEFWPESEE